jgi:hypothetical protein
MPIDPRTLDITDDMTGAFIPYPGYGGDIALDPPETDPAIAAGAGALADTAVPASWPRPQIGLSVADWRSRQGMAPLEEAAPQGFTDIGPEMPPSPRVRADAAAATLAPNAFQFSDAPVSMDNVSLAGMAANMRADSLINARHQARRRAIDATAATPMQDELEARRLTAELEETAPMTRPLIGARGAFQQDPETGAYTNAAPAEKLADFRKREAANLHTILGQGVMRQLQAELGRIERGVSLDEEGQEAPLAQPMSDDQKESARREVFQMAAMALQNFAGGKDYSGYFRQTYDPNAIRIGQ